MTTITLLAADSPQVIQINLAYTIAGLLVIVLGAGVAWGGFRKSVEHLEKDVEDLKKDMKKFSEDLNGIKVEFGGIKALIEKKSQGKYAQPGSPKKLTPLGNKVLNESGIKDVVDENKAKLIKIAKQQHPANAYDAEECAIQVVKDFVMSDIKLQNGLKNKTFSIGESFEIVLFVGGLYFRDIVFPELGYTLDDVDKHDPHKKQ